MTELCKKGLSLSCYKKLSKVNINIIGHKKLSILKKVNINLDKQFFCLSTKNISINKNYIKNLLTKININIQTKNIYNLNKININITNDNTVDLKYYANVLYEYNVFIKENINVLFEIFKKIHIVTDINFDLFLYQIDEKQISNIKDISNLF